MLASKAVARGPWLGFMVATNTKVTAPGGDGRVEPTPLLCDDDNDDDDMLGVAINVVVGHVGHVGHDGHDGHGSGSGHLNVTVGTTGCSLLASSFAMSAPIPVPILTPPPPPPPSSARCCCCCFCSAAAAADVYAPASRVVALSPRVYSLHLNKGGYSLRRERRGCCLQQLVGGTII